MRKSPQQRWLEKVVDRVACGCGCGTIVEVKQHQTHASYIKRAGGVRYVFGHQSHEKAAQLARERLKGKIGPDAFNWKGGRSPRQDGYVEVYVAEREHNLEHRVVMERNLGRKLASDELVHHQNELRDDNRISNLVLMDRGSHARFHNAKRDRDSAGRFV